MATRKNTKAAPADVSRVDVIRDQIYGALESYTKGASEMSDARTALDTLGASVNTGRKGVLLALAKASVDDNWSEAECKAAADAAVQRWNDTHNTKVAGTLATFAGQIRAAIAPKVRALVPSTFRAFEEAFASDNELVKSTFKRSYLGALQGLTKLASEDKPLPFESTADVADFARTKANAIPKPSTVAAAIKRAAESIKAYATDYPSLAGLARELEGVTRESLKAEADRLAAARNPKVSARPDKAPKAPEPAEGPLDIDAVLDGLDPGQATQMLAALLTRARRK